MTATLSLARTNPAGRHVEMVVRCFAVTLLLIGAVFAGGADRPHMVAAAPGSVTGLVRGPLGSPVIDTIRHLVYGRAPGAISVLDEATGRTRTLTHLGRGHGPVMLAIDPVEHRLLVEDLRTDRFTGPHHSDAVVTALADDIDTRTGRVVAAVPISTFTLYVYTYQQGSVAIDRSLHHGFVTDHGGQGVMLDMGSGRILARFHPGTAASEDGAVARSAAAVDERSHRLFIAVGTRTRRGGDDMVLVDTASGRIIRRLKLGLDFTANLVLDPLHGRVMTADSDRVVIVSSRAGTFLRRVRVPVFADLLAAAPRYHRVFLLVTPLSAARFGTRYLEWIDDLSGQVRVVRRLVPAAGHTYDPATGIVESATGRLFTMEATEPALTVFATATGRLLARFQLLPEVNPLKFIYGMAVDEGTHRLIIGGTRGALLVDTRRPFTH